MNRHTATLRVPGQQSRGQLVVDSYEPTYIIRVPSSAVSKGELNDKRANTFMLLKNMCGILEKLNTGRGYKSAIVPVPTPNTMQMLMYRYVECRYYIFITTGVMNPIYIVLIHLIFKLILKEAG